MQCWQQPPLQSGPASHDLRAWAYPEQSMKTFALQQQPRTTAKQHIKHVDAPKIRPTAQQGTTQSIPPHTGNRKTGTLVETLELMGMLRTVTM